ncbi:MAG: hypothetical protein M2R46_00539 [Verrucomicrobia subdivision 3 bacterium]|nr:hypothetical protein [Limisphaerales bacterium]
MKVTRVTAYESKTRQAEIFRRAAAGETIIVTNNGVPQVEIRRATTSDASIAGAIKELAALQKTQLAAAVGGGQGELRRLLEEERD